MNNPPYTTPTPSSANPFSEAHRSTKRGFDTEDIGKAAIRRRQTAIRRQRLDQQKNIKYFIFDNHIKPVYL